MTDNQLDTLPAGKLKRIHVNQHIIRANAKCNPEDREPPISIKNSGKVFRAWKVTVKGETTVMYSPDKPLDCGAKVWIETKAEVC